MPTHVKVRLICISDTHSHSPGQGYTLPPGDILLHAGDLTNQGSLPEFKRAIHWLEEADYPVKIVVAGNHDLSLDEKYGLKYPEGWNVNSSEEDAAECRRLLREARAKGVLYLEHESKIVDVKGVKLKVFGSPYSPDRGKQNWAFQYASSEAEALWATVPDDTDVLITHTPPKGYVDTSTHWTAGGCPALTKAWEKVRPRLLICGHCHEGRGADVVRWDEDGDGAHEIEHWQDPGKGNKKMSLLDLTEKSSAGLGAASAVVNASVMAKSWGKGGKEFNKPIVVDIDVAIDG